MHGQPNIKVKRFLLHSGISHNQQHNSYYGLQDIKNYELLGAHLGYST
jgi:hypothetical protein